MGKTLAKKEPKTGNQPAGEGNTNQPTGNTPQRTPVSKIGKRALLEGLFEGSGYVNKETVYYTKNSSGYISSSKTLLEGVDFDLTYTPLKHLGYKSVLLALGNIYAACFHPKGLSCFMALSARFCVEDIQELWSGVCAAAKEHHIEHLSLDLTASLTGLTLNVSATGEQSLKNIKSFPAVDPTCLLCLTGNVGAAYMGLHVLEREKIAFNKIPAEQAPLYKQPDLSKYKYLLSQYLSPEINPKSTSQFQQAKLFPSVGYFITKGLAASVRQLCEEHGTGAKVYLEKIPIAAQTFTMAEELHIDAITAALNGGDDYKFLFAVPVNEHERFHQEFPNVDIIGHLCKPEAGCSLMTPDGAALELKSL